MLGAVFGGGLCAGAATMAYAVRSRSARVFGPSVYRGSRSRRSLALTFDDGPSEGTWQILEVLQKYRVPATFFLCGANVERLPTIARAIRAAGHEIGNHSHTHPVLCFRSPRFIEQDLARAQAAITHATGISPRLFRSPFGIRWFGLWQAQRRLSLQGVMWTVLGQDWKLPARGIVKRVLRGVRNGAIICLHDGRQTHANPNIQQTVDALRQLIPVLRAQGFRFETVSQILCRTN